MKEENQMKNKLSPRYVAVIGMFTALAVVSVLPCEWIPKVSGFLSYEPKDVLILVAGFIYGPLSCIIISLLASFIEMITFSTTGIYGFIMNFVSTMAFTLPAAFIYYKTRTKKTAVIGLAAGVLSMAAVMVLCPKCKVYTGTLREKRGYCCLRTGSQRRYLEDGEDEYGHQRH